MSGASLVCGRRIVDHGISLTNDTMAAMEYSTLQPGYENAERADGTRPRPSLEDQSVMATMPSLTAAMGQRRNPTGDPIKRNGWKWASPKVREDEE